MTIRPFRESDRQQVITLWEQTGRLRYNTAHDRQPQSSCPFQSARRKIYRLGYHLLIFVYDKSDNDKAKNRSSRRY